MNVVARGLGTGRLTIASYDPAIDHEWDELVSAATSGALGAVCEIYAEQGFTSLRYKAVPHIYHRMPSADDIYALVQLGARLVRCELSCAIDLSNRGQRSERRRRGEQKAKR